MATGKIPYMLDKVKTLYGATLRWGVGSNASATATPRIELRNSGNANDGTMGLSLINVKSDGLNYYPLVYADGSAGFSKPIEAKQKTVTIPANANNVAISADSWANHSFFCWLSTASSGWVGNAYIENILQSNTRIWTTDKVSNDRNVLITALYYKTS